MASPQPAAAPPSVSQTVPSPPPLAPPPPPPPPPPVVSKLEEKKPSEKGVLVPNAKLDEQPDISHFEILDSVEYIDKCKKYEADYTQRLMAKYFSKKDLYGGNIFDEKMTIDNETIMSSKWPCTLSFADPVKSFEEQSNTGSTSTSEA
ncbi:PREDICTED: proline-rich protein 11 [Populus euphratica]|uniref:Proline-rich protein 11 n=1 Tax=Populus euphratica TaxID=75702 RepID=A0AAJ6TBY8_POPEU|nr:PREDICTED: proline-rich protein 11 [Populus euphratica]